MRIIKIIAAGASVIGTNATAENTIVADKAHGDAPMLLSQVGNASREAAAPNPDIRPPQPALPKVQPTPAPNRLSSAQRRDIDAWIRNVMNHPSYESGPNPDPYYSEFWIRMKPAGDPQSSISSLKLAGLRLGAEPRNGLIAELRTNEGKGLDIVTNKFVDDYLIRKNVRTLADWSEEVFAEITPDFAEMDPAARSAASAARIAGAFGTNGEVTVRIRKQGDPVSADHFLELLRQINATKTADGGIK